MKAKIFSILLLIGCILPIVILELKSQLDRIACRVHFDQQKNQISSDRIQIFTFSKNVVIQWERKNKEFTFNGKLYDVVDIDSTEALWIVKCVSDEIEDKIASRLVRFAQTSHDKNGSGFPLKTKNIIYFGVSAYFFDSIFHSQDKIILPEENKILSVIPEINSPPPEYYYALLKTG